MADKHASLADVAWDFEEGDEPVREIGPEGLFGEDGAADVPSVTLTEDVERMRDQLDLGTEGAGRSYDVLVTTMAPARPLFWKILGFCQNAQPIGEVEAFVEGLQANRRSVYVAADYCRMLEECGCLIRVDAAGEPYDSSAEEPSVVEVDGRACLIAGQPPEAFWLTTEAGVAAYEKTKPFDELMACIAENAPYRVVYARILELASAPGGRSIADIKEDVNRMPVLNFPAKTAQLFIEHLERHQAIAWDGAWKTTELGQRALAKLTEQEAA